MKIATASDARDLFKRYEISPQDLLIDTVSRVEEVYIPFIQNRWPGEYDDLNKDDELYWDNTCNDILESRLVTKEGDTDWQGYADLFNYNEWVNEGFWAMLLSRE